MRLAVTLMQILAQFGRPKPAENGHLKPVQIFQKIWKKSQNWKLNSKGIPSDDFHIADIKKT